ncbi:MAG: cobalamin biosynthesis protein CbiX [Actinobacteria bacterium]|nr:cobalamin biosynthesis protein CbiX [Actinomycetota bacterium]
MPRPALLAVSHGTSDVDGAAAIALLVRRVAERLRGREHGASRGAAGDAAGPVAVHEGFVDVQQPDAPTALAALTGPAVIVPLLLSQGFHVRIDLGGPAAARPKTVAADPLGPDPRLAEVLATRLEQATSASAAGAADPVILAIAGSRDPRSLADAEGMAGLLAERLDREVVPAYLAAREPSLATALRTHPGAPVATYLLAHGYFFDVARRVARRAVLTEPLLDAAEPPDALVDLVIDRYLAGEARLPDR